MLEKTFDDVVIFYKHTLEEKDKKLIGLFTDKYGNEDLDKNSDFVFQSKNENFFSFIKFKCFSLRSAA